MRHGFVQPSTGPLARLQTTTISANLPPLSEFFAFCKLFRKLPSRPLTASHGSATLLQTSNKIKF
jgi:hypothetical protein